MTIKKNHNFFGNGLCLHNCGYRGEIMSVFHKSNNNNNIVYKIGDRGAQLLILPYPKINFVISEELNKTERNDGGYGSSDK